MQKFLFYSVIHAQKFGSLLLCLLLLLVGAFSKESIVPESLLKYGTFTGWLMYLGIFCLIKLLFGGWASSSLKGMGWSVLLSSIAGLGLSIMMMKSGGGSISAWGIVIQLIISITAGVCAYNWVDNLLSEGMAEEYTLDNVVDSVFDNGLKATWGGFMDDIEGNMYYAASRGVAVYSNVILFSGLIIGAIF